MTINSKAHAIFWLISQGLGVVVMAVGLWLFWTERREAKAQADACHEQLMDLTQQQVAVLQEVRDYLRMHQDDYTPSPSRITRRK